MKPEEIAAYIGAAAWLPQIVSWIYSHYITPKVTIIPNQNIELGFTNYGPILNLTLAFSSDRRDAIIHEIKVILKHQDGDRHEFRWMGMTETISQITDSTGNRQTVSKDQTPIAFKIGTDILLEKFVRFQEPRFQEETYKYLSELVTQFKFLKEGNADYVQKTFQSKEFHDVIKVNKEAFWWKPGKYVAQFILRSPRKFVLEKHSFYFIITQLEIDELRQNINKVEQVFTETIKSNLPDYKGQTPNWYWCYPAFFPE